MIKRLIEWCTQRPGIVLALVGASLVYAVISFRSLSLDALPDLSDPQVIVYTKWPRSPEVIQRHVTRPLILALNGIPGVKTVRGITDFGFSYVFVIFDERSDTRSARAQIREALATAQSTLPAGVQLQLGPDGSSVGWVYQYALVDRSRQHDLAALRSFHDRVLKPVIQSAEGVAEIASVGGHVKQIQILANQAALQSYNIPWMNVVNAVVSSSSEADGSVIEVSGAEHMIRSRGNFTSLSDIESIPVFPGGMQRTGSQGFDGKPILLRDIAVVTFGPAPRRGLAELNGEGEVTGGIVVKRSDSNALHVIQAVKEKIASVELPKGVEILPVYDRSELIHEAVGTLSRTLLFEMLLVTAVIVFFLRHPASAVLPLVLLPVATILCCIPMKLWRDFFAHHVLKRDRPRNRYDGGCRHRLGGKRSAAARSAPGGNREFHQISDGLGATGSRPLCILLACSDDRELSAHLCPRRAVRSPPLPPRLHQIICIGDRHLSHGDTSAGITSDYPNPAALSKTPRGGDGDKSMVCRPL